MKKSTISIIIYIVIFLSILTTSILFDNEIIFFVGLIGIIALYIILNRLEQSKISSFLLSYIKENDNFSAINYLKSKEDKCFFIQSNLMIKIELAYRYLAIDDFENFKLIINSKRINNLKQIVYAKFILAVVDGDIKHAEEYQRELAGLNVKQYGEQITFSLKILNMIKHNNFDQEVYNNTHYNCIKKICEQIKDGTYKIIETRDSIEVYEPTNIINNKFNFLLILFFVLSIASIFMALISVAISVNISPLPEFPFTITEYMWEFYLFIPIPLASIVLGIIFKQKGYKCKKNIIVGFIMTPLLFLYGCFSLIFANSVIHDRSYVDNLSNTISISIPSDSYVSVGKDYNNYEYVMMIKLSKNASSEFIQKIENIGWKKDTSFIPSNAVDLFTLASTQNYDYFAVYNETKNIYNDFNGDLIYLAFDIESRVLYVIKF